MIASGERPGLGVASALGAAALYGLIPNFSRAAFENGIPTYESTFFRTAVIAVALAIVCIGRGERLQLPRVALWPFLAQAAATAAISICYLAASQFIPVGLAVIIFFTFPILILITAPVAEGELPGAMQFGVAILAFAGLAVALASDVSHLDPRGILLAGAAALCCVVQFYSGRKMGSLARPAVFGSLVHFAILPVTFLVAVWMNGGTMKMFTGAGVGPHGLAFLGGVALIYVFAYLVHMTSLSLARATTVAPFYNLEPIVTIAVAALLLGERLTPMQYLGGSMVLAALVLSSLADLRRRAAAAA